MDDEIIIRKQAVEFHLNGTSTLDIARKLGKSRQWVHKWVKCYQTIGGNEWYRSISRTPRHIQSKTPKKTEDLVISIRKGFESRIYSQTGALSIMYEFERMGLKSPSLATINRILRRNNQINKSSVKQKKNRIPQLFYTRATDGSG